ncbi:MAG: ABC transporter permease [Chloroflexi bacterium]|nr:ABC transporter permease [Chloroflexota bacterium]
MTIASVLRTALDSMGANKLRAGLTLLGIVIGVAAVITLMSIGRGAQKSITSRIEGLGTNLLFIRPGSNTQGGVSAGLGTSATLTLEDAQALADPLFSPAVASVAPELGATAQLRAGTKNTATRVVGVTPEYQWVRNFPVASGQFITATHVQDSALVVVLGARVAETLFGFRDPVGQTVRLNGREFTVIGVLQSKGGSVLGNLDDQALVPITTAYFRLANRRTTQGGVTVQTINLQAVDQGEMDAATQQVATVLRLRHRITGEDDFTISSQQDALETLQETTNTFVVFLGAIAGISLLVGGIGVMNIMLVSVTERTREIGIRKAMGAKRRDVLLQFLTEATLLTVAGGGAGVALGLGASQVINGRSLGTQTLTTAFSGDIALLAMVVSAVIGLFFGIYPAMRAARLRPIEALRHE